MARSSALVVKVRITGVRETLKRYRELPKNANDELRKKSKELAQLFASKAKVSAATESRQAALIAPTIRAVKDRVPAVTAGGNKRIGRNRKPAYKVLFGSEFGATTYKQFKPHNGAAGYWFFPLVERDARDISAAWNKAANEIADKWGE